jgi:hypothetical protein
MNERIKELAEQASVTIRYRVVPHTFKHIDDPDGLHSRVEFNKEKFAELIVRECMEQVWYTREDGINGNVSEVIKERIKEHFGVEE